jgi:hypothetical protein
MQVFRDVEYCAVKPTPRGQGTGSRRGALTGVRLLEKKLSSYQEEMDIYAREALACPADVLVLEGIEEMYMSFSDVCRDRNLLIANLI